MKYNIVKSIPTWLPIYSGNYGTIWEDAPNEEREIDWINEQRAEKNLNPIEFDDIEFNYADFYNDLAELITDEIENELKEFVYSVKFNKLESPREYNFTNDSIHCEIKPKIKAIREYIESNFDKWSKYLKDNYTSYDGFYSHHSNSSESDEWQIDKACKDRHKLGAILNFIGLNEGIDEWDIYDNVIGNVSMEIKNYNKLMN